MEVAWSHIVCKPKFWHGHWIEADTMQTMGQLRVNRKSHIHSHKDTVVYIKLCALYLHRVVALSWLDAQKPIRMTHKSDRQIVVLCASHFWLRQKFKVKSFHFNFHSFHICLMCETFESKVSGTWGATAQLSEIDYNRRLLWLAMILWCATNIEDEIFTRKVLPNYAFHI